MAVTLRDIAKHVNLSHATVSFVLNDRRDVAIPETTRKRVMDAAQMLGYHPNRAARALVMGRTRVVGLWTPELNSAYLQRLFQGLTDKFRLAGFDSLYCRHSPDFSVHPFEWPVDGIVFVEGSLERHDEPFPVGVPIVVIGSRHVEGPDLIRIDLASGAVESVMHLLETGRKRIVCVTGEQFTDEGSITDAYCRVMESAGYSPRCLTILGGTRREKWRKVLDFLKSEEKVDAFLCTSEELSTVTRRAIADSKLKIPSDTALVGFDYSEECDFQTPSLSAVEIPVDRLVELAGDMLMSRMAEPRGEPRLATVHTSLRILESSARSDRPGLEGSASVL